MNDFYEPIKQKSKNPDPKAFQIIILSLIKQTNMVSRAHKPKKRFCFKWLYSGSISNNKRVYVCVGKQQNFRKANLWRQHLRNTRDILSLRAYVQIFSLEIIFGSQKDFSSF